MAIQPFRFDLKFLFMAFTNACVVVWGATAFDSSPAVVFVVPFLTSLTTVWYGLNRNPILLGALGGIAGSVAWTWCLFVFDWTGYFFHTGPDEYFEDGLAFELFAFWMLTFMWGMIGGIVGLTWGAIVGASNKALFSDSLPR